MPLAPAAKGLIIASSIIVAAGIAISENEHVREFCDSLLRKFKAAWEDLVDDITLSPEQKRQKQQQMLAMGSRIIDGAPGTEASKAQARRELYELGSASGRDDGTWQDRSRRLSGGNAIPDRALRAGAMLKEANKDRVRQRRIPIDGPSTPGPASLPTTIPDPGNPMQSSTQGQSGLSSVQALASLDSGYTMTLLDPFQPQADSHEETASIADSDASLSIVHTPTSSDSVSDAFSPFLSAASHRSQDFMDLASDYDISDVGTEVGEDRDASGAEDMMSVSSVTSRTWSVVDEGSEPDEQDSAQGGPHAHL